VWSCITAITMFTTLQQREFNKIQQTVNIKTKNKYAKLETANCAAEGNHICSKTLNKLFFKSFTVRQKSYKIVFAVYIINCVKLCDKTIIIIYSANKT